MKGFILAFYLGIQCCLQLSALPDLFQALFILLICTVCSRHKKTIFQFLFFFLLGFIHTSLYSSLLLSQALDENLSGKKWLLTGKILELPEKTDYGVRFIVRSQRIISDSGEVIDFKGKVRLSWKNDGVQISAGQTWNLYVKVKSPHGFVNPGSFDFEFWLFKQGINATGYVLNSANNTLIHDSTNIVHGVRSMINHRINHILGKNPLRGLVKGLITGTRHEIQKNHWEVLQKTGTSHLMAISGLHVGLVALFIYLFTAAISRLLPVWSEAIISQKYYLLISFVAALVYGMLAGFSLPTQRALIMLAIIYIALLSNRQFLCRDIVSLSAFVVLIYDPFAVLAAGFYLSFIAVGIILLVTSHRFFQRQYLRDLIRIQFAISIGLMPLLLFFFQEYPLLSLPANLIAVPVMSFMILPGLLFSLIVSYVHLDTGQLCMDMIMYVFDLLWVLLEYIAGIGVMQWHITKIGLISLLVIYSLLLMLVLPVAFPRKNLVLIGLSAVVFNAASKPFSSDLKLTVLDVGQGLSIVIQIKDYVLLYDAGPRISSSFDTGKMVVLPFLAEQKIESIDTFIISHQDNDHAGGSEVVLSKFPVSHLISDKKSGYPVSRWSYCKAGMQWYFEGTKFETLHPETLFTGSRNNRSCVLKVTHQGKSILIPGDVEAGVEKHLVKNYPESLKADILVVPHHGSKSSSTEEFLHAVSPEWAIFSTGYLNRYNFPNQVIIERLNQYEIKWLNTSKSGAITMTLSQTNTDIEERRDKYRRFWHHSQ